MRQVSMALLAVGEVAPAGAVQTPPTVDNDFSDAACFALRAARSAASPCPD